MSSHLHEQLTQALLAEMASGYYRQGDRFLSNRKICQQWKVSDSTTGKSLLWLQANQLIEANPRSGYVLKPGFRHKALLLLHQRSVARLPSDLSWRTRRFSLARGEKTGYRIACVFSGRSHVEVSANIPTYFDVSETQCAQGFFAEAIRNGGQVEFYVHNEQPDGHQYIVQQILQNPPDGVAVFRRGRFSNLEPVVRPLMARQIPVVTVFDDCNEVDVLSITINNVALGYDAAKKFIAHGHRRLAVLLQSEPFDYFTDRLEGCRLAIEELPGKGLTLQKITVSPERSIPRRLLKIFEDPATRPTALLATRVDLFARLLPALRKMDILVPRDLSVITVLGKGTSKLKLDNMNIDFHGMGALAMEKLAALIKGEITERSIVQEVAYLKNGTVRSLRKKPVSH